MFFLAELKQGNNEMMLQILKDYNKNITLYTDLNGFTLLHHAVLVSKDGKVQALIDFAKSENGCSDADIEKWVNKPTLGRNWTALHFSSFTGHLDSAYALIDSRADIFVTNQN